MKLQVFCAGFFKAVVSSDDASESGVRSAPPESMVTVFNFDVDGSVPLCPTEPSASSGPPSPSCKARDRRGSVRRRKRGYGHGVSSPSENMPWFEKIVSTTLLLRNLIYADPRGSAQVAESLAAVVSTRSSSLQRLLIVTNISTAVSKKTALDAIRKACKSSGGIHESSAYIPEVSNPSAEELSTINETDGKEYRAKSLTDLLPSAQQAKPERILGYAVVQLKSAGQVDLACQAIATSKALKDAESADDNVGVAKVNSDLLVEGTNELAAFAVFDELLNLKLFNGEATVALREIFSSCAQSAAVNDAAGKSKSTDTDTSVAMHSKAASSQDLENSAGHIHARETEAAVAYCDQLLTNEQICTAVPGNLMLCFLSTVCHAKDSVAELVSQLLSDHGSFVEGSEEKGLGLNGFIAWVLARGLQDVRAIWKGIAACGYDLQLNRFVP